MKKLLVGGLVLFSTPLLAHSIPQYHTHWFDGGVLTVIAGVAAAAVVMMSVRRLVNNKAGNNTK